MKLADQIVSQLQAAGVRRIYGIVGDSLNPIVDAVRRTGGAAKGGIDWVHVRHEEVGAFAAATVLAMVALLTLVAKLIIERMDQERARLQLPRGPAGH